ncbi:MAG TPA: 4'-phosphopantetheinyl transferase superfamily protein [Rhodanobacteraceae bacterium]|nr:4'-phosphopantetheinyl transferase superfamily protein [Rhodanobacteraceae bacterium]
MTQALAFSPATPAAVAGSLDDAAIHLWRFRYALSEGRAPFIALIAAYLDLAPEAVELVDAAGGKPRLTDATLVRIRSSDARSIEFNWSHSGGFALIALARALPLGVDIERIRVHLRALEIARRFFGATEAEAIAALDARARDRAFIALWCAKEAVLKAQGKGLAFGLARVAFAPSAGGCGWQPLAIDAALGGTASWQLAGFEPISGYRGALAWRGAPRAVHAYVLEAR